MIAKPKRIIPDDMLANMEMLAVTNPGMRDILEQAKVIYTLNGSPNFYDDEETDDGWGSTDDPCLDDYDSDEDF